MALRTRIVLALTLLALALPASAFSAGWTGFSTIPTSGATISGLKLESDSAGNQVAIWVEQPSPFKVQAAFRPTGGSWGSPQTLDSTATTSPVTDLAVDPSGNFIVLYSEVIGTANNIYSAYLPAGSTSFGNSQLFANAVGGPAFRGLAIAFAANGTATAVSAFSTSDIGGTRPAGAGSTWTINSAGLPAGSGAVGIDLAVTGDGTATLLDTPAAGGQPRHTRFNGTTWVTITTPGGATAPLAPLVILPDAGNRTTSLFGVSNTSSQITVQSCPPGVLAGTTCDARAVTWGNGTITAAANPSLSVNPTTGDAIAAWTEGTAANYSRRSGPTGAWSPAAALGTGTLPAARIDSSNGVMTVFRDGSNVIQFLTAGSGASLVPPASPLTDPAQTWTSPTLSADTTGDLYGAWVSTSGTQIQSAVYDVNAPTAPAVTAPANALVGDALTFAAAATDTWGPVSYAWDFGDGSTGNGASASHSYATPGSYIARATASDGVGNTSTATQTVTVSSPPPIVIPPPSTLPPPVLGKSINLVVLKDPVSIKEPGEKKFKRLTAKQAHVPNGTVVDTRKGRVLVVIDNGAGGQDSAEFYEGVFEVNQPKSLKGLANIFLNGGGFKGCPKAPKDPHAQLSAGKKANPNRSVRHLWGKGTGKFRTVGRFASATVRGTQWLTDDRCNGTLVRVKQGKVAVRDFVRRRTIALPAPKRYLAQARATTSRKSKKK